MNTKNKNRYVPKKFSVVFFTLDFVDQLNLKFHYLNHLFILSIQLTCPVNVCPLTESC